MLKRLRTYASCLLLGLALAGCRPHVDLGESLVAGSSSAGPTAGSGALDAASYELLTRQGVAWAAAESMLIQAEKSLTQRCMAREGLKYFTSAPIESLPPSPYTVDTGYGIFDQYEHAHNGDFAAPNDPEDRYRASLPIDQQQAYRTALFGSTTQYRALALPGGGTYEYPGAGCTAAALGVLYGSALVAQEVLMIPQALEGELAARVTQSAPYVMAQDRWQTCMAKLGFDFATSAAAQASLRGRYATQGLTPALHYLENRTAAADARCATTVRLAATLDAGLRAYAADLSPDTRKLLSELNADRSSALSRATHLLDH